MKKNLYNFKILSERIEGLRKDKKSKRDKTDTLVELSSKIEEKTGIYISNTTLGKFENAEDLGGIKLLNLIAIANYYEVSLDYLFGKTDSKSYDCTKQTVSNRFGLSDKSMKKLSTLANNKYNSESEFKLKFINYIIENNNFINVLIYNIVNYFNAKDNEFLINDDIREKYGVSKLDLTKYSVVTDFEKFIDDCYNQLWSEYKEKKEQIKLFDIPKRKWGK